MSTWRPIVVSSAVVAISAASPVPLDWACAPSKHLSTRPALTSTPHAVSEIARLARSEQRMDASQLYRIREREFKAFRARLGIRAAVERHQCLDREALALFAQLA